VLAAWGPYAVRLALYEPAPDARGFDLKDRPRLPRRQHLGVDLADRADRWRGPHRDSLSLEGYYFDSSPDHLRARVFIRKIVVSVHRPELVRTRRFYSTERDEVWKKTGRISEIYPVTALGKCQCRYSSIIIAAKGISSGNV
jgi:hypothetical protein